MNSKWGAHDHIVFNESLSQLKNIKEPFFSTYFSIAAHHPFCIPDDLENKFDKNIKPIERNVLYLDFALKEWFYKISKCSWFENTLFIFRIFFLPKSP